MCMKKETPELTIRMADKEDIEDIRAVAAIAFPATYRNIITDGQIGYMMEWMYSPRSIRCQIDDGHVYYIAYCGNRPVGYVSVQQEEADLFHLHKIYVLPENQGLGLGRLLFRTAIDHIRENHGGRFRLELNVNRNNKALGFYRSMGMEIAREGDFDIGNGYFMNDYIMSLEPDYESYS